MSRRYKYGRDGCDVLLFYVTVFDVATICLSWRVLPLTRNTQTAIGHTHLGNKYGGPWTPAILAWRDNLTFDLTQLIRMHNRGETIVTDIQFNYIALLQTHQYHMHTSSTLQSELHIVINVSSNLI